MIERRQSIEYLLDSIFNISFILRYSFDDFRCKISYIHSNTKLNAKIILIINKIILIIN
jgi:hypothetical protein